MSVPLPFWSARPYPHTRTVRGGKQVSLVKGGVVSPPLYIACPPLITVPCEGEPHGTPRKNMGEGGCQSPSPSGPPRSPLPSHTHARGGAALSLVKGGLSVPPLYGPPLLCVCEGGPHGTPPIIWGGEGVSVPRLCVIPPFWGWSVPSE